MISRQRSGIRLPDGRLPGGKRNCGTDYAIHKAVAVCHRFMYIMFCSQALSKCSAIIVQASRVMQIYLQLFSTSAAYIQRSQKNSVPCVGTLCA